MPFLDDTKTQNCTYWAPASVNEYGSKTFDPPTAIKVRWEDRTEIFIDLEGREQRSRARVYPDRTVVLGGYLFLGTSTVVSPYNVTLAFEIRSIKDTPSVFGDDNLIRVLL